MVCSEFYVLKSTERDAKFTRSDFKNKLPVLYFIHYNSLLISVLEIYYQCLTSFYKATEQEKWISAMKELETPHTCKPSTNGGSYFIEVQLLQKFNFRNDRGKKIYIIQWYLQNRFIPAVKIYKTRNYDRICFPNCKHLCEEQLNSTAQLFSSLRITEE